MGLATVELPPDTFYKAMKRGDLIVKHGQQTVGFAKPLTHEHHPGISGPVLSPLCSGFQEEALNSGYQLLANCGAP